MTVALRKARPPRASGRRFHFGANARWSITLLVIAIAAFIFYDRLPQFTDSVNSTVQNWAPISAINDCLVYAIMALGLNIVVGYAGLLDLGYVAFWAIGSYLGAWLMSTFWSQLKSGVHIGSYSSVGTLPGVHFNFWLVLVLGAAVCATFGLIIGAPTLRLRGDYLAIVTLAFGEIIPAFFLNGDDIDGHNITNGSRGINPIDPINTTPLNKIGFPDYIGLSATTLPFLFLILVALVAFCIFVSLRIRSGRLGRSWLAIREDELAANMMGVSLVKAKLSAYAVGAAFGGLGGVAYTETVGGAQPTSFNYQISIFVLIMVVLGGMGNVWGVLLGAIIIDWINNTGLNQLGSVINSTFNANVEIANYSFLIFGVILVLMMLFRREGLLPERRVRQIMREPSRTESESLGADIEVGQAENTDEAPEPTGAGGEPVSAPAATDAEATTGGRPSLQALNITIKFGGLVAVNDVSFTIPQRSVVSLIGPNGAGKTTFFNILTGLYQPTSGTVELDGRDVTGRPPHKIAQLGLARTFQNIRLFNLMTAEENVMVAMHSHLKSGIFGTVFGTPRKRREEREAREFAAELLDFVGIGRTRDEYARSLSYGDQRRLEVARALALRPKVLLLDEPTAGMNPQESAVFTDFVHRIRDERELSVLLIEHDMSVVMRVSQRITVLDRGEVIAEGGPDDIRRNQRVVEAYLGKSGTEQAGGAL